MSWEETQVTILAGGAGTRLLPLTRDVPKILIPVAGAPLVEHVLQRVRAQGFRRVTLLIGPGADRIRAHFGDGSRLGLSIRFHQEEQRLGTSGCLSALSSMELNADRPLLVLNGDIVTTLDFRKLLQHHCAAGAALTLGVAHREFRLPFGVIQRDGTEVTGIREKPGYTFEVSAGIYALQPCALRLIPKNSYLDMPDYINQLIARGLKVATYSFDEKWHSVDTPDDVACAEALVRSWNQA